MLGTIFIILLIIIIAIVFMFVLQNMHHHHETSRNQIIVQYAQEAKAHRQEMDKVQRNVKDLNFAMECVTKQTCKNRSQIKANKSDIEDQKTHLETKKITVGDFSISDDDKEESFVQPFSGF